MENFKRKEPRKSQFLFILLAAILGFFALIIVGGIAGGIAIAVGDDDDDATTTLATVSTTSNAAKTSTTSTTLQETSSQVETSEALSSSLDTPIGIPTDCGKTGKASRIVNGEDVTDNSIPFIVSLNIKTDTGEKMCGGSIVNSKWVVTAAHCFEGMSDEEVKNSEVVISNLHLGNLDTGERTIKIEQGFSHPDYETSGTNLYNDIYLIKIGEAITFNDKAQPICISDDRPSEGEDVIAAGWGRMDVPSQGEISEQLKKVTFPVQADSVCKLEAKETTVSFCAGNPDEEKDSCQGDSGGPLYKVQDETFTLVGVTSYGLTNECTGHGIYTTTSAFKNWMKETMENNQ